MFSPRLDLNQVENTRFAVIYCQNRPCLYFISLFCAAAVLLRRCSRQNSATGSQEMMLLAAFGGVLIGCLRASPVAGLSDPI